MVCVLPLEKKTVVINIKSGEPQNQSLVHLYLLFLSTTYL